MEKQKVHYTVAVVKRGRASIVLVPVFCEVVMRGARGLMRVAPFIPGEVLIVNEDDTTSMRLKNVPKTCTVSEIRGRGAEWFVLFEESENIEFPAKSFQLADVQGVKAKVSGC